MINALPRRHRRRPNTALVVVVAVLLAAGGGTVAVLAARAAAAAAHRRNLAAATAATAGYLADWSRGDIAAMSALSDPATAPALTRQVAAQRETLAPSSESYRPAGPLLLRGSVASQAYTAQLVLQGLGPFSYRGTVPLRRITLGRQRVWRVEFGPGVLYPGLTPGQRLTATRTVLARATVQYADGSPIPGTDGELDANLVGSVRRLTRAEAARLGPGYRAGQVAGVSGLERAYDQRLAGHGGGSVQIVDAAGRVLRTLRRYASVAGAPVRTTIVGHDQAAAEAALAGLGALPGAMVAIDTATGAVTAIANHPIGGYPLATVGTYPAGSTFKLVTTTAALLSGVSPDATLDCAPKIDVQGRLFQNASGEQAGPISFERAFAISCNTAFIRMALSLPAGAERRAAELFGIGTAPGPGPLPIPSFGGTLPAPRDDVARAAQAIGQGRVLVSPLEMASIAAAVDTGTWRQPYVTTSPRPAAEQTHALPAGEPAVLHRFMAAVVAYGTAAASGLPPGTYGKTGTAEYGSASPPATYSWFVAFRGGVAVACVAGGNGQSAGFGASVAAPAVGRFFSAL